MRTFRQVIEEAINSKGVKAMNELFKKIKQIDKNGNKVGHDIHLSVNGKLLAIYYQDDEDSNSIFMSQYGKGKEGIEYHKSIDAVIKYIKKLKG